MEYFVQMTTHVPAGTPEEEVDAIRSREAARARDLAAQGSDEVTPLSAHPNDPGAASGRSS